jgi:hypothetical protein
MRAASIILCTILVFCASKQPKPEPPPPSVIFYYDTVVQVQYMGMFHDVPKLRLKNNNNTFKVIPSGSIINIGDIVETKKTVYSDGSSLFESTIKGTDINIY